jgi:hypothetical protein
MLGRVLSLEVRAPCINDRKAAIDWPLMLAFRISAAFRAGFFGICQGGESRWHKLLARRPASERGGYDFRAIFLWQGIG